ncbi:Sulfate transport system permease protein CysW [Gimesia panareensis]|uniref:Sulfate transport system permease protein CysW n=1 Tax=Gimesia panareensis TaxID=2527978 RepID=A0A518FJN9_9PLAN|nr:ABC transporter permease [Gimesia panareensis]QDV16578.1 Sulfate transport system permease protein CysW [Gimesia panareensis]
MSGTTPEEPPRKWKSRSDLPFYAVFVTVSAVYVLLIVAMLAAETTYTTPGHILRSFQKPEIQYAIWLSLVSCAITTVLSLWVSVPIGYLMSRHQFPGKTLIDAILDIPIVLPPLVIGLCLLILFQLQIPQIEWLNKLVEAKSVTQVANEVSGNERLSTAADASQERQQPGSDVQPLVVEDQPLVLIAHQTAEDEQLKTDEERLAETQKTSEAETQKASEAERVPIEQTQSIDELIRKITKVLFGRSIGVTYEIPSIILAQFMVACAFAVRTMRVTFDQIGPRYEQVALTLGCNRGQAFWRVVFPQAYRGLLAAATLAWARSLGEFGPILIFSGATRMKTEVLPTTVFLELTVGNIEGAVAASLIMVVSALVVLVIARLFGLTRSTPI